MTRRVMFELIKMSPIRSRVPHQLPHRIQKAGELIAGGRFDLAARIAQEFRGSPSIKRWSPEDRTALANLYRRLGWASESLRLLGPALRSPKGLLRRATPEETAEYVMALLDVGAWKEVEPLLAGQPATPKILLARAFARFHQWDYPSAVSPLEQYLAHPTLSEYERFIGEVNLSAALAAAGSHQKAATRLASLMPELERARRNLLLANCLEIQTQIQVGRKDWEGARESIRRSRAMIEAGASRDHLFVAKWELLTRLGSEGWSSQVEEAVVRLREEAIKNAAWEVARDLDFHVAETTGDSELKRHLYFGTPFASYRKRIGIEGSSELQSTFLWRADQPYSESKPGTRSRVLDSLTLTTSRRGQVALGTLPQKLLAALALDFYRPKSAAELFQWVSPGAYFNPSVSPGVVYQAVRLLKQTLGELKFPLRIESGEHGYRLRSERDAAVRVYSGMARALDSTEELNLLWLREGALRERGHFCTNEVARALGLTRRSAERFLAPLVRRGSVTRENRGRERRYRFGLQIR